MPIYSLYHPSTYQLQHPPTHSSSNLASNLFFHSSIDVSIHFSPTYSSIISALNHPMSYLVISQPTHFIYNHILWAKHCCRYWGISMSNVGTHSSTHPPAYHGLESVHLSTVRNCSRVATELGTGWIPRKIGETNGDEPWFKSMQNVRPNWQL